MKSSPSVLFGAPVLPDGEQAIETLARDGHTMEYVKDQFRHCKTILALGSGRSLLEKARIMAGEEDDPGILLGDINDVEKAASKFVAAIAVHRHPPRHSDPPKI